MFNNITIVGLGLMGGSLAKALKARKYGGRIIAVDPDERQIELALGEGWIDSGHRCLDNIAIAGGLVIVAAPLGAYELIFTQLYRLIAHRDILVSDVGSVKGYACDLAERCMPRVAFIGGHPMAGSEKAGLWAASAHLFENAYYFLTPCQSATATQVTALRGLVEFIGAAPVLLTPDKHDSIVARISHVPHCLATALAGTLADEGIVDAAFAGGGFRDTTRIAAGQPELWQDILLGNRAEVLVALDRLTRDVMIMRDVIERADGQQLRALLARGKFVRDGLPKHSRDYLPDIYNIYISVVDRPGIIADLTNLIGSRRLSISEIEIMHARQDVLGAIRIGFATRHEACSAKEIIESHGYQTAVDEVQC